MSHTHAVVWMDHLMARVISYSLDSTATVEIRSTREDHRLHRKSGRPGSGHLADDLEFFEEIIGALAGVPEVLIAGPGTAKKAFEAHLRRRHPLLAQRIVGVETVDHPSDGELLAQAKKLFARVDALGLDRA